MDEDGAGIMQNLFTWNQAKTDLQYPQRPTDIVKRVCPPDPCTLSPGQYAVCPIPKSRLDGYIFPQASAEGDVRITATLDVREEPQSAITITKVTASGEKIPTESVAGNVCQPAERVGATSVETKLAKPAGSTSGMGDVGGEPGGMPTAPSAPQPESKAPSARISAVSKLSAEQPLPSQKAAMPDEGSRRITGLGASGAASAGIGASGSIKGEEGEAAVEAQSVPSRKSGKSGIPPGGDFSVGSRIKSPSTMGEDSEWVIAERVKKVVDVTDIRHDTTLTGKDMTRIRQLSRAACYPPRIGSGQVMDLTGPMPTRTTIAGTKTTDKAAGIGEICKNRELKLFLAISLTSALIWGLLGSVYLDELLNFMEEFGMEALASLVLMTLLPITLVVVGLWRCCRKPDSGSTATRPTATRPTATTNATKTISGMTKSLTDNVACVIEGTKATAASLISSKEAKSKELYKLSYEEALSHAAYQARCGSNNEPLNLRRDTMDTYRTRTSVSRRTPISKPLN